MASSLLVSICLTVAWQGPLAEQRPAMNKATIARANVAVIDEAEVPAREAGQLTALEAREGMVVEREALLGRIDDQVARMAVDAAEKELEIAQSQAESNINVDVATKTAEVTRAELEAAYAANREQINSMSKEEVRRRHFAAQRSILQIKQAELEQSLAALAVLTRTSELGAAEARLSMHEITSPLDGLVTRVHRQLGEWVNPGDPVVSIARPDRLRVEGYLNMNDYAPSEIAGRPVRVSAELARGQSAQFDGKITLVQFEIQSDNSYEIWAEVLNRQENGQWLLRPGMKVSMEIQLQNGTAGGPGAGPSGLRQSSATRGSTRPTSR